jgi:hypothetical protein
VITEEDQHTLAQAQIIPWVGDHLTVKCGRMLQRMKTEDSNSFEQMAHIVFVFGWFHVLMNLGKAIFHVHYSGQTTNGLGQDSAGSRCAGLTKPTKKKCSQHHTLDELLQHSTAARVCSLWLWATGLESVELLKKWTTGATPQQIRACTERIWEERVSSYALDCPSAAANPHLLNTITLT